MDMETFWKSLLLGQKHFWRKMGIERINSNLKSDGQNPVVFTSLLTQLHECDEKY